MRHRDASAKRNIEGESKKEFMNCTDSFMREDRFEFLLSNEIVGIHLKNARQIPSACSQTYTQPHPNSRNGDIVEKIEKSTVVPILLAFHTIHNCILLAIVSLFQYDDYFPYFIFCISSISE